MMKAFLCGLTWLVFTAARPSYIDCNLQLTQSNSGANIMTTTVSFMGASPGAVTDSSILTSQSASTFSASSTVVFTLDSTTAQKGVVHATAGSVTGGGYSSKAGCTGTQNMVVDNSGTTTSGGRQVSWTAPSDITGISSVTISFVGGPGYGQLKRHSVTLTTTTSTPTNAPTNAPSNTPTNALSYAPSNAPTNRPTNSPTNSPTAPTTSTPTTTSTPPSADPVTDSGSGSGSQLPGSGCNSIMNAFEDKDCCNDGQFPQNSECGVIKENFNNLGCCPNRHGRIRVQNTIWVEPP